MQATEAVEPQAAVADGVARRWTLLGSLIVGGVLLGGMLLRFLARSELWLDESLSVNIAGLPLGDIGDALRHDGHPPLYYLLLHGWMEVIGDGDFAVRSLSGLLSVATLPVGWVAARRYAGRSAAVTVVLLLAVSPFALRYATEARMYSLVMLLVFAGWLALRRAAEQPSWRRLLPVALISGLLLLTHYWSLYLIAAVVLALAWSWWRGARRQVAGRLVVAVVSGALLFLPWLPGFLEQAQNTGTPWGRPERPTAVLMVSLRDFGGIPSPEGELAGIGIGLLALLGVMGRAIDRHRVELDFRTREKARPEAAVLAATVLLAVAAGYVTDSAFASRYMAAVFPILLLLAGLGATRLGPLVRVVVLLVLVGLSLVGAGRNVVYDRTQGGVVADGIDRTGTEGDVVGFCPDQLGPATDRYLDAPVRGFTYPDGGAPQRVDWVDYRERVDAGDPKAFARKLLDEAGPGHTVWLVWRGGYSTHGEACETLARSLAQARPSVRIRVEASKAFESMWLYEYPPA